MVVENIREILEVNKQASQTLDGEKFNMRVLKELEVKKEYQVEILIRFAALRNISDYEYINRAWENIKENIKTSAKESLVLHELKQHKPWFDKERLNFLNEMKQAKLQWVQDPSQRNIFKLNSVRQEATRHFRNKKETYLKAKIEDLGTNSMIEYI